MASTNVSVHAQRAEVHARIAHAAAETIKEQVLLGVEPSVGDEALIWKAAQMLRDAAASLEVALTSPALRRVYGVPFSVELKS
jgi:hypothetical protein